jgi:protein gp37
MAENSKIEWTTHTFNPWRGCTKVHAGCTNCYAEQLSGRNPGTLGTWGPNGTRVVAAEAAWREPLKWNRAAEKAGERHRVFCASLADVFEDWQGPMHDHHGEILEEDGDAYPRNRVLIDDVRARLFALIDATPNLDWLLLTKRPENVRRMWPHATDSYGKTIFDTEGDPLIEKRENVWIGTSVSNQPTADEAIHYLMDCEGLSPVLFLSAEPLIEPIDFRLPYIRFPDGTVKSTSVIDWVIVGGESGPKARPCNVEWIRSIQEQCKAAGVPCFIKQLGSKAWDWSPHADGLGGVTGGGGTVRYGTEDKKGGDWNEWPESLRVREFPQVR